MEKADFCRLVIIREEDRLCKGTLVWGYVIRF